MPADNAVLRDQPSAAVPGVEMTLLLWLIAQQMQVTQQMLTQQQTLLPVNAPAA